MPDNCKLMFAEYEGEAIACVMNILYGNKQWYLYGGSSNKHFIFEHFAYVYRDLKLQIIEFLKKFK